MAASSSLAPPSENPFDQIDEDAEGKEKNPFDAIGSDSAPQSSTLGSFARGVQRGALPAAGGLAAFGTGAEVGALAGGLIGGPAAPLTATIGGLLGGIGTSFLGATAVATAQNWAMSKLPDSWVEAIGMDEQQQRADEQQHPVSSFLGGLTPYALTMRPGAIPTTALPENATALQRILAHPVTARVFGGGVNGGMELGMEAASDEDLDWRKIAISTGFGMVFNRPTKIGERITELGARPVREASMLSGLRERAARNISAAQANRVPTVADAADMKVMGPGITEQVFRGTHEQDPSAAMTAHETARTEQSIIGEPPAGPDVHDIARRLDPDTFEKYDELTSRRQEFRNWIDEQNRPSEESLKALKNQKAELEQKLEQHIGERGGYQGGPEARKLRAQIREVDTIYNELNERGTAFAEGRAQETPELSSVRRHLLDTEFELRDLRPQVQAAYRRAADAIGGETVLPEALAEQETAAPVPLESVASTAPAVAGAQAETAIPAEVPVQPTGIAAPVPPVRPIEAQKAAIADDVTKQLIAAGRPAEEAGAAAQLLAARYEARAARFKGALGTAEDIYRREGAEIRAGKGVVRAAEREFAQKDGKELFQKDQAPAFYSAVDRAVSNAKQDKASGDQWLGTLKNIPGVKQEELEWLGLNDFLKGKKSITKTEVQDFVRANQVEVKEVEKGGGVGGLTPSERMEFDDLKAFAEQSGQRLSTEQQARLDDLSSRADYVAGTTKFSSYQLPGGENYRELLLTLPEKPVDIPPAGGLEHLQNGLYLVTAPGGTRETFKTLAEAEAERHRLGKIFNRDRALEADRDNYRSNHFDEANILAHVRFNDRIIDGKKTLFIEEVQSDWHQRGRSEGYKEGYKASDLAEAPLEQGRQNDLFWFIKAPDNLYQISKSRHATAKDAIDYIVREKFSGGGTVPDAPFKTTWPELAMKRMIRYAAENGYDKIAWTTGEQQAQRYDLSKQVDDVAYLKNEDGTYTIDAMPIGESDAQVLGNNVTKEKLADIVGKDLAEKIIAGEGEPKGEAGTWRGFSGIDLKVGGEGMKGFYDQILPSTVNKLVKKFGGKVKNGEIKNEDGFVYDNPETYNLSVHTLDLTPELKDVATEQGFPLFQGARGKILLREGKRPVITLMKDANASTFIHETGHQWLEELMRDAGHELAPDILKDDATTIRDWLGVNDASEIKTRQHEKFARGFEQYMREGTAPSAALANVFHKFKNWLLTVYQTIKGLGKPINDDIRQVFDRMLVEEPQRTVIAGERERGPSLADIHETDATHTEPQDADAAADLIAGERARYIEEPPPEIRHEIEAATAEFDAARAESSGQAEHGAAGPAEVAGGSGEPEPQPARGGMGKDGGKVGKGRSEAPRESADRGEEQQRGLGNDTRSQPLAPSPATLFGPRESPFVDKAGNIRVENLTSREDVAQAIRDSAKENQDFVGDRRGTVTDGQVMDLADALGMDYDKLMRRKVGDAFNAEQIVAARKLLVQSATDVSASMKKAASGTDDDVMAYAMAKDRHQLIQAQVAGITAEAGRALRAFRSIAGQEEAQVTDQFIKGATGKTLFQLRMEAKLGSALDTPQQVSKFLQDAQKRTYPRMILEYWINGLLSAPATHMTNIIGNTILTLQHFGPETQLAAVIGSARRVMGRGGETIRSGEFGAAIEGLKMGSAPAIQATGEALRAGVSALLPGEKPRSLPFQPGTDLVKAPNLNESVTFPDVMQSLFGLVRGLRDGVIAGGALLKAGGIEGSPLIGTQYSPLGAIPDIQIRGMNILPIGTTARLPGRFLAVADSFFKSINYSMAKNTLAYRTAANEGLTGMELAARVAELRSNPPETMMEASRETASELTLMARGSPFVEALSKLTNTEILGVPILKFVSPFVHIAGSIIDQSIIKRSPVGLLSSELRADLMGKNGNIAQDTATARMLAGTALAMTFGTLAAEGLATGSGPTDPREAAMWRLAGNQAHSVRIGDMWYDTQKLGPLGMLMGVSADMYDVAHNLSEGELLTAASELQHAFTQNVLDQSFMRGPADLIRALEDSDRYGEAYVRNFLSSFVPASVGMGQMARAGDPYSRQARTVMDAVKAKVPGLSETLFPRRDIWGEPMPNKEAVGGKGITAIYVTQMSKDPVNRAMLDLGIYPAPVQRKIRNVELTDDQYDDYSRIAGRMTKMRLDAIVRSPNYQAWPNHIRHDVLQETISQSREAARGIMLMKNPAIVKAATEAKLKKIYGETDNGR